MNPKFENAAEAWPGLLSRIVEREPLSSAEAAEAMRAIMREEVTPAQVAGFLLALRTKGETVDEMEGFADAALEGTSVVQTTHPVVDTCGTGGDRAGTFNISTLSALVVAGAGVRVAKHGNRAASSHCGSADILEALGVRIDLDASGVARCLDEVGIGFMFAPKFHPAMAYAVGIRRELKVPTLFNFLGPLTNPAKPDSQVIGVSDGRMLHLIANVLARRGTRAMVFRGHDGLDELTTTMPSLVYDIVDSEVHRYVLDPEELGIEQARAGDLKGGDLDTNVAITRTILEGEHGPRREVVLLNAAAALTVSSHSPDMPTAILEAADSIDSGRAAGVLERWVEVSNSL
jgi:anthranilate phosphoribosyltransferase